MASPTDPSAQGGGRKRASQYVIPASVLDFRNSWPVVPGLAARPTSVAMPPQYTSYEYDDDDDDDASLKKYDTTDTMFKDGASVQEKEVVLGSTEIYDKDGNLRLIPVCNYPTSPWALRGHSLLMRLPDSLA